MDGEAQVGPSLQERHAPRSICFGCGPANADGLRLASHREADGCVATWTPAPHHEAFAGVLNGGIIGALLDCHANWTAAIHLMELRGAEHPPATVTADLQVRFLRPTPSDGPLVLAAHVVEAGDDRAVVEGSLAARGRVTATCRASFVAVRLGHPAYQRWSETSSPDASSARSSDETSSGR